METYDVVVLGSGAAGLTAALAAAVEGARVAVFEKAELIGGTTALSGAVFWIPANRVAGSAGIADTRERGLEYIMGLSNGMIIPELADALVDGGQELIDFLEVEADLSLQLYTGYPDYHAGGLTGGGRSLEVGLASFDGLEGWSDGIAGETQRMSLVEMPMSAGRVGVVSSAVLAERAAANLEGMGRALIGSLLRACLAHGVHVHTSSRGLRLLTSDDAITGVEVQTPDAVVAVEAPAVILATGGFENDEQLVRDFLRGPLTRSVGAPTNSGDGLRMAMRVGAQLGNMREAWWTPVVSFPGRRRDGGANGLLSARERALPGSIMVNRAGKRFANEGTNYNAFGGAFHHIDESRLDYPNVPAFLVFDQAAVDSFGVFGGGPGAPVPGWVTRADTLDELATALGISQDGLGSTVARFNENASAGIDPDFHRGDGVYERYVGGARLQHPDSTFATLGPVATAPFYGAEVMSSALGTKGGPRTDANARVLNVDGDPIRGLYAAGDVMASPLGMVYTGAGAALAVAGVFGMLAGKAAAQDLNLEPVLVSAGSLSGEPAHEGIRP